MVLPEVQESQVLALVDPEELQWQVLAVMAGESVKPKLKHGKALVMVSAAMLVASPLGPEVPLVQLLEEPQLLVQEAMAGESVKLGFQVGMVKDLCPLATAKVVHLQAVSQVLVLAAPLELQWVVQVVMAGVIRLPETYACVFFDRIPISSGCITADIRNRALNYSYVKWVSSAGTVNHARPLGLLAMLAIRESIL